LIFILLRNLTGDLTTTIAVIHW